MRVLPTLFLLMFVPACGDQGGSSSGGSSNGGGASSGGGPVQAGQTSQAQEQGGIAGAASKLIRQGHRNGPPPPAPGITAGQCNDMSDGGALMGGSSCITGVLECGQTITGHTGGGVTQFDSEFYAKKFCTPQTTDHSGGGERIYKLHLEDPTVAVVTLDTPCADLDLFGVKWPDRSSTPECPNIGHNIKQCEANRKDGTTREEIRLNTDGDWLIVVEGVDANEGAFALTVQCGTWF